MDFTPGVHDANANPYINPNPNSISNSHTNYQTTSGTLLSISSTNNPLYPSVGNDMQRLDSLMANINSGRTPVLPLQMGGGGTSDVFVWDKSRSVTPSARHPMTQQMTATISAFDGQIEHFKYRDTKWWMSFLAIADERRMDPRNYWAFLLSKLYSQNMCKDS